MGKGKLVEGWLAVKRDGVYLEKRSSQYLQNYMRLPLATTPRPSPVATPACHLPLKEGNLIRATGCIKTALLFVFFLAVCSNASDKWQFDYETGEDNFTKNQRWKTWGMNFVPGLGSYLVMDDWHGATVQWVLGGGGIAAFLFGLAYIPKDCDVYYNLDDCSYDEKTGIMFVGVGGFMLASSYAYSTYRSITYNKPKKTAYSENSGFNIAVLPNRNGKLNAFLMYNKAF